MDLVYVQRQKSMRMYLETMTNVLPQVESKIIIDDGLKGLLPLLNLNKTKGGE